MIRPAVRVAAVLLFSFALSGTALASGGGWSDPLALAGTAGTVGSITASEAVAAPLSNDAYFARIERTIRRYDARCFALLPSPSSMMASGSYDTGYALATAQRRCYRTLRFFLQEMTPPPDLADAHASLLDYADHMTGRAQAMREAFDALRYEDVALANLATQRANRSLDNADQAMAVWREGASNPVARRTSMR